jgi:hypothetical protein
VTALMDKGADVNPTIAHAELIATFKRAEAGHLKSAVPVLSDGGLSF